MKLENQDGLIIRQQRAQAAEARRTAGLCYQLFTEGKKKQQRLLGPVKSDKKINCTLKELS